MPTLCIGDLCNRHTSQLALRLHRGSWLRAFISSMKWDESIVIARHDEAHHHNDNGENGEDEAANHHWVVAQSVELWECEGEDDCQHWSGDVAQEEGHECRDLPVLALSNDDIQVAADLISLW